MEKFIIILLPITLFIGAFVFTVKIVKKNGGIKELFKERVIKEGQEVFEKTSASRFILFLTSLTAIIISICLLTYFLYASMIDGEEINIINLKGVMEIVFYLGIGVVPYGANQLKGLF